MLDEVTKPVATAVPMPRAPTVEDMLLQFEVERFLYDEAALLDERRYGEWLALFTEDVRYWMPIRRTKTSKDQGKEFTGPGEMSFIDDGHAMLAVRCKRLKTGYAWAEDPPSRTRRLVTNVRVVAVVDDELEIHSNFQLYRTRLNSEEDNWIGQRQDRLRRVDGRLMIAGRTILLEQTVLLSPNLSSFF